MDKVNKMQKKQILKWLSDNWDELEKHTKITPIPTDDNNLAEIVVEIGTLTTKLEIHIPKSRMQMFDEGIARLAVAQHMGDMPIKLNGKS